MSYTNFNMRLDDNLRASAYPVLEQYGLTPSQAVQMFFHQIGQTGKIPLSFDWRKSPNLSANGEKLLNESIQDIENGDYTVCHGTDELMSELARIANE